jgi:hypothetical protein
MLQDGIYALLAASAAVQAVIGTPGTRADTTTGVFKGQMPEAATLPCVVYSEVHGEGFMTHDGPDPMQFARISLSCYGSEYTDSKRLARAVRQVLEAFTGVLADGTVIGNIQRKSEMDTFADAPSSFVTPVDFDVTHIDAGS